jgi:hypothetical protein
MEETTTENPTVKRLPTCPESHRESIDVFLVHMRDKIELALNDHRVAAMRDKSPRLVGMVKYLRSQLACLNWLIQTNAIRRKQGAGNAD